MAIKAGRPIGSSRTKRPISTQQLKVLLKHIKYHADLHQKTKRRWWQVAILSYYLGTRISELLQLSVGDLRDAISRGEASLSNKTKTKKPRLLVFSPTAIAAIKKYFAEELKSGRNSDLLFHSPKGKTSKLHPVSFTRQFNALIHEALGNLYSTHSFRKGVITDMAKSSINPKIVQFYIGHKNLQTTLGYFTPSDDDVKMAISAIR